MNAEDCAHYGSLASYFMSLWAGISPAVLRGNVKSNILNPKTAKNIKLATNFFQKHQ